MALVFSLAKVDNHGSWMAVDKRVQGIPLAGGVQRGFRLNPFALRGAGKWVTFPVGSHETVTFDLSCTPDLQLLFCHY